jgi:hypothetical protein
VNKQVSFIFIQGTFQIIYLVIPLHHKENIEEMVEEANTRLGIAIVSLITEVPYIVSFFIDRPFYLGNNNINS